MEDSERRKKRLKEMRQQADLAEVSGGIQGSGVPGFLSNPLVETSSTVASQDKSHAPHRFDFYTDPMSVFSSDKRSNANIQASQGCFRPPNIGGSPMAQFPSPYPGSTNPQMTPSPSQVFPAPYRNPVWNGPRGPAPYNFPFHPSGGGTYPNPRFEPSSSPSYNYRPSYSPNPSPGYTNTPSPRFEPSRSPSYNYRPNYSPNPSPGYTNNPSPSRGRGRGSWQNTRSPVSGRGGGQGRSSRGHWSNEDQSIAPERYYKRSMIEDPWKFLQPVIWKAVGISFNTAPAPAPAPASAPAPENSKSWTSKSVSTKRDGSSAAPVKFSSEPSLAEYLASALNEAAESAEKE
ncbi:protein SICKLE-like [Lotus japonicus]|uniref:protein SICKLE-like n=1 Tax=Lotus japonicus TaxID=34305 RepID=UPI00258DF2F2|nr:protein SICKLE-like [Lotus japonicus]XP_057442446.1 protein SICKLE-like [Lotus japonicus]